MEISQEEKLLKNISLQFKKIPANEPLRSCTYKIDSLGNVTELNLSSCRLEVIPKALFQLLHLQSINLFNNQIDDLPIEFSNQENLKELILSKNNFANLPVAVLRPLRNLRYLDISNNNIETLPEELNDLSSLEEFRCDNNPIKVPPPEIVKEGFNSIKGYFKSVSDSGKLPLNEVKVIFVGDGGAGKTSLVKRLATDSFDPYESQTHGINITSHDVKLKKKTVNLNIWDFGGQEIMHATHQFFLSKRSLYVLVLDSRKDEKHEYWLKHIESFGGTSPILIVLNKVDENPSFEVNRKFLKSKYNGILGYYRVSCATKKGISEFKIGLKEALSKVDIIETEWPRNWFNVKKKLLEANCNYISYDQFRSYCEVEYILDQSSQESLVEFLHDLGTILHFTDFELLDTQVLNPYWVTDAVYRIINSEKVSESKGLLKINWLRDILTPRTTRDYKYPPEKFTFIINLMLKFELCYQISSKNVLIPDLLNVQEPEFSFDYENSLHFRFDYDFLPKSIMPRFIVRLHADICDNLCWRTGVVLHDNSLNSAAVIKADDRDRTIKIWVSGEGRKDYFAAILYTLRHIHSSFEKLYAIERVPMPDNPQVVVSYSHLILLGKKGIDNYIPDGSEKAYNVKQLLGAIEDIQKTENEILGILKKMLQNAEDENDFIRQANRIVQLQPNFFGIGVNINNLISKVLKGK